MILTVGSTKGGVGKTTLAVNLTVALALSGQDVLLIDGDEDKHSIRFSQLRENNHPDHGTGYTAMPTLGQQIRTEVRKMRSRFDQIVIDVAGRDNASLRNALLISDMVLVPAAPRSFDLWGADGTGDLIRQAREFNEGLRALAVLSLADPAGNDNNDAISALQEIEGLEVSETRIVRRKAYPNAIAKGLGILEYRGDGADKAQAEFMDLFSSIYPKLKLKLERIA